ncbi:MAG: cyclic nucleotide-binding domain-containing protein [Myxococcota bacterium]
MSKTSPATNIAPSVERQVRGLPEFAALEPRQFQRLMARAQVMVLAAGEQLMAEGERGEEIYFLLEGRVVIHRRDPETGLDFEVATSTPGETIGELSMLDPAPRAASVRTDAVTTLLKIHIEDFDVLAEEDPAFLRVKLELAKGVVDKMRTLGQMTAHALGRERNDLRLRNKASTTIIYIIGILCVFALMVDGLRQLRGLVPADFVITSLILVPLSVVLAVQLWVSKVPLSEVGVTLKGWRRAVVESLVFSLLFVALLVGIKAGMLAFDPTYANTPLFDWFAYDREHDPMFGSLWLAWGVRMAVYVIGCPLQEFVARGVLQSSFQRILTIRHARPAAIVLASLIFATMHLYTTASDSLAVFIPGLAWGWLYSRHRTLVGVTLSHIIIGVMTMFVLGGARPM